MSKKSPDRNEPILIQGKQFLGIREAKKLDAIFAEIVEDEKEVIKLLTKSARAYYDAGNILTAAAIRFDYKVAMMGLSTFAKAIGYPEKHIRISFKIFKHFENNPDLLNSLSLRDALKLIAPPPPTGEEGYNRIDLGGDPGLLQLDFGELFAVPAAANQSLHNYRTVADLLTDIIVVQRTKDNRLTSKRFMHFCEDVPQNKTLLHAYKTMSQKTQAAIEDYLAVLEQEENS
jgi:hypothetical protein